MRFTFAIILLASTAFAGIVEDVVAELNRNDFAGADRQVQAYLRSHGTTSDLANAVSWEARAALAAKQLDRAAAYADQTRQMTLPKLLGPRVDREQWLYALGASIEVQAQVMASKGDTPEALSFLRTQLKAYAGTSLRERIQKNINLLGMEGKPAPELEAATWFGAKPPSIASLRGKAVLLFFWAHWCPDCKADVPIIAGMMKKYGPQGLVLIGPTRYYGYVANGDDAPPAIEKPYIDKMRRQFYAPLADMPVPLSDANFNRYGASTTPTLVLVDRKGIVRWYHPGSVSGPELASQIQQVLK
jgi:thiol-disulfide isomerase/thioredoxin